MEKVLIVIDMQNDFVSGALGTPEAKAIVENVKKKIEDCEKAGYAIYFTRDTHFADSYFKSQEGKKLPVLHCLFGTEGWKIVDGLNSSKYRNIDKESFGWPGWAGYFGNFEEYSPKKIELVGVCTDICVISNAMIIKSYYPETEIVVDASCCAGTTPEKHHMALEVMKSCQINIVNATQ